MNINQWKQKGKIYIWKYHDNPRNYHGWHFTGDSLGCDSLIEFLTLLSSAELGTYRTLKLNHPTPNQHRVPGCKKKVLPEQKLIIERSNSSDAWEIMNLQGKLKFELGASQIDQFISGVKDVKIGNGDYSIKNLWFWWNLSGYVQRIQL
ncbi:MAG: hypothetical protein GY710_18800 [Desulfobacteraceae bacterium]|nr:hypothetical protein [Desulfobacteraceae bacterium]